ncbi:MAG: NADH-quinone oxidoreductase subunit L [Actinomycetota bacterium]
MKSAWLIPVLPYAAFFVIVFFGKRLPGRGAGIGIGAVGASLAISIPVFFAAVGDGRAHEASVAWFRFGGGDKVVELGMHIDGLAAVMFLVVCTVSLLVQIYSTAYMHGDSRYTWYYAVLSLFTGSMLNLVIANNLIQMLIGWEGVGICSYLLIGHWHEIRANSNAAIKAFLTTRLGDVGFTFGIFALFAAAGTFNIAGITEAVEEGSIAKGALTLAAVLLFAGAIGKSAQVPLHVWLPDAMAGPTPVSALIHAATMVVAGVYLVARMYGVFHASTAALGVVAVIGAITMLMAAVLALVQDDIKRVLAYSTISQLAYMVAALGVGAYTASVFHIFTHAWFKALLFLGAGSVSHAVHSFSMAKMGGLKDKMPVTYRTYLVGSLALAGFIPLAGFWSKDEIIHGAFEAGKDGGALGWFVFVAALITAFLTALYVARMLALTFFGKPRYNTREVHPHESPRAMTIPLVVLAVLAVGAGWVGIPGPANLFERWVHFGEGAHDLDLAGTVGIAALSTVLAAAGFGLGWLIFAKQRFRVDLVRSPLGWFYRLLENRYYVDEIYMRLIVRPIRDPLARFAYWTNQKILDGVVNLAGAATLSTGSGVYHGIDQPVIDGLVNGAAFGADAAGRTLKFWQSGNVQLYAAALFLGLVLLMAVFLIRI